MEQESLLALNAEVLIGTGSVKVPEIGEIRKAREIGYKGYYKYIWAACLDCGRERWQELRKGIPILRRCPSCASREALNRPEVKAKMKSYVGEKTSNWRGGRRKTPRGYILVRVYPGDFFFPMATKQGYVLEHRLVVAKALGRCLQLWEIVHHKHDKYPAGSDEDKQDNRYPENLELIKGSGKHNAEVDKMLKQLLKENRELRIRLQRYEK